MTRFITPLIILLNIAVVVPALWLLGSHDADLSREAVLGLIVGSFVIPCASVVALAFFAPVGAIGSGGRSSGRPSSDYGSSDASASYAATSTSGCDGGGSSCGSSC